MLKLTDYLERNKLMSMSCIMLDMYSDRTKVDGNIVPTECPQPRAALCLEDTYKEGQSPIETCPLYDKRGYRYYYDKRSGTTWIKGGPRARVLYRDIYAGDKVFYRDIYAGPALNKTPLIYWKPWHACIKSVHELTPPSLNRSRESGAAITGALLHAKFSLSAMTADMKTRAQANEDSGHPIWVPLFDSAYSKRFDGWMSLVEEGLMSCNSQFKDFVGNDL